MWELKVTTGVSPVQRAYYIHGHSTTYMDSNYMETNANLWLWWWLWQYSL